jgi:hypothetical protein
LSTRSFRSFRECHLQIKTAPFLIDFHFKSAHPRCFKTAMPGSPIFDNDNWTMEANRRLSRWRERVRVRVELFNNPPHLTSLPLGRGYQKVCSFKKLVTQEVSENFFIKGMFRFHAGLFLFISGKEIKDIGETVQVLQNF